MARKHTQAHLRERAVQHHVVLWAKRMPEFYDEFDWATEGRPLPIGRATPPLWVKNAIIKVSKTAFGPLMERQPNKPENVTHANLLQLSAMGAASINVLTQIMGDAAEELRDHKNARRRFVAATKKIRTTRFAPAVKRHQRSSEKLNKKSAPATVGQYQENLKNLSIGSTALFNKDGAFRKGTSMKAELYQQIWFYWPQLVGMRNTAQMREAIFTLGDAKPSLKTVEAVCTELGVFRGKRGRPAKKILRPQKFA